MTKSDCEALFSQFTDRVGIDLVRISAVGMDTLYLCRNTEPIIHGGMTYLPVQMEVSKPEKGSSAGSASLRISNVTREYIQIIQELSPDSVIDVWTAYLFADDPDPAAYLDGPYNFTANGATLESATGRIDLSLTAESVMEYYAGQLRYESKGFPAIWT